MKRLNFSGNYFTIRIALLLVLNAAVVWFSGQTVLRTVSVTLVAAIGPALLLYSGLYGLAGTWQAWRGQDHEAASMLWESVAWAAFGAAVVVVLDRPAAGLVLLLSITSALLQEQRPDRQRRIKQSLLPALGLLAGLLLLVPLIWMLIASLRGPGLPQPERLEWWPTEPSFANYLKLSRLPTFPLLRYVRNSVLVSGLGIPLALLVAAAAAFALLNLAPRWRRSILILSVVGLAVPNMALWLPRFLIFRWLHLLNTPVVLLLPALIGGTPLCVLLLYRAFRRVPSDQWDQARIDGASVLRMWWQIGLPQVRSSLVGLTALVFTIFWGNFTDPLLYLTDPTWHTLPVGLQSLQQLNRSEWPVLMAGAVIAALPAIVVFALVQGKLLETVFLTPLEKTS